MQALRSHFSFGLCMYAVYVHTKVLSYLDKYQEAGLLDHVVRILLVLRETAKQLNNVLIVFRTPSDG